MKFPRSWRRVPCAVPMALGAMLAIWSGCATAPVPRAERVVSTALSPSAEAATVGEAWRLAESFAATTGDCEVLVGCGDSMLPFYTDRTVLVVRRVGMSDLRAGMTVVFTGDTGRPVAHALVEKTTAGWVAMGVGNRDPDRTLVRYANLVGVVVKAYATMPMASRVARADVAPSLPAHEPAED